jgi:hypothetical protein
MDQPQLPSMMTVKKVFVLFIFILALGMLFPSCYYDKDETLYPFLKCDTSHVTYSQTIVPILSANCLVCHGSANPQGGVILDSWTSIQVVVTNGKLIPAIDHTGPFQMPKGGSMLEECTIEKIKRWVANGAPNN